MLLWKMDINDDGNDYYITLLIFRNLYNPDTIRDRNDRKSYKVMLLAADRGTSGRKKLSHKKVNYFRLKRNEDLDISKSVIRHFLIERISFCCT